MRRGEEFRLAVRTGTRAGRPSVVGHLLVRAEEKNRGLLEVLLYASIALSAIASIWQFAQQPVKLSAPGLIGQSSAVVWDQA